LSLALHLIKSHNHRVRIATHPDFKDFVIGTNKHLKGLKGKDGSNLEGMLEFYDAGGDPKSLMAYMVKSQLAFPVAKRAADNQTPVCYQAGPL
jgi:sterol 3beta-glucosyltransferase